MKGALFAYAKSVNFMGVRCNNLLGVIWITPVFWVKECPRLGCGAARTFDAGQLLVDHTRLLVLNQRFADHLPPDSIAWVCHEPDVCVLDATIDIVINGAFIVELERHSKVHQMLVEENVTL